MLPSVIVAGRWAFIRSPRRRGPAVIFVEDWTGLELHDDDVERIDVVGDLIRLFESAKEQLDRLN
jgi:hypothetical protein